MKNSPYPCLWFDDNAKDAADFYCSLFIDSKIVSENQLVVMWELNGKKMMELNGGPMFKMNPSISMFVLCETIEATNNLWDKLMDGGKALMPIDKYSWSERYGWVQDKFGFTWQVSVVYNEGDKQQITPCMLFTDKQFGKAEEAVKFYTSVFKISYVDNITYYPQGDVNAGKVMYSEFKLNNYQLIAMDGPGDHKYTFNEAVSIVIDCDTQEEIDYFWDKLTADGGAEGQCGWLKDKFGVSWQVVPTILGKLMSDPVRSQRVMQAFLTMKKFDIEKLVNA